LHILYIKFWKDSQSLCTSNLQTIDNNQVESLCKPTIDIDYYHIWSQIFHNFRLGLTTKANAWKGVGRECNLVVTFTLPKCKRVWGNEPTHSQVDSHFGSWSPCGLPNFQGSKFIELKFFLILLEISWDVDV